MRKGSQNLLITLSDCQTVMVANGRVMVVRNDLEITWREVHFV